jgi:preprotein translocase subunit SecG
MTRAHKLTRTAWSIAAVFVLALVLAVPASASVTSEQQEGAQTLSAVHAGKLKGTSLSSSQYEHVGEYLMGQALGSTAAHERMNSLADQMMGSTAVDQMHVYLGERYLGKSTAQLSGRYAPMYGLIGMMTGYRGSSISGMMSGYLNSHGQSQSTGPHPGTGMMGAYGTQPSANSTGGWPTGAIIATAVLAALLLAGALALGVPMLRRRGGQPTRGPASTPVG